MPALKPTDFKGRIVWLGVNANRDDTLCNVPVSEMELTLAGCPGESRAGMTRPSCGRVQSQYPRGTEIRNTRQLSIVSAEELAIIASNMGVETFDPAWISASMVVEGIPDFTMIPPSSRLQFTSGATLTVDMENRPCVLPAPVINAHLPGKGKLFKTAAKKLRGVTTWVERAGILRVGGGIILHIPDQPAWPHLTRARQQ